MKKLTTSFAAITILSVTTGSMAQPPGGQNAPQRRGPVDRLTAALDANGDGEISVDEIKNAPAALKRLDSNRDGSLTENELLAGFGGFGRGRPGGGGRERAKLVDRFDEDKDGRLNRAEREKARRFASENNAGRQRGPRRGPGASPGGDQPKPGPQVARDEVDLHPDATLYDEAILRTFFLEFEVDDWEQELAAFYRSDVQVPATLTVDGKDYRNVGVKFRGNSSFFTVGEGQKRSFNLTLDFVDKKQDIYGYRTLNLLNAHSDPSFVREAVYNHIARNYIPAPQANFVKLVVNGESWGIYVNAQQFNKEFTAEWFGERDGVRWKVPAGPSGRSLNYNGEEKEAYSGYELKSKENEKAWKDLIKVCRSLHEIPVDELDTKLDGLLNIDRVLWFLALDNVLLDTDGYHSRGSDYVMYQDTQFGRFHVLPYDSNEVFREPGRGGGPGRGRGGFGPPGFGRPGTGGLGGRAPAGRPDGGRPAEPRSAEGASSTSAFALSPFAGEDRVELPLLNRLLANPRIRARYVAHVRTITNEWLDWKVIGNLIADYRELIDAEIEADTRKLSSYESFRASADQGGGGGGRRPAPGLKRFIEARQKYLASQADLVKPAPVIRSVSHAGSDNSPAETITSAETVRVSANVSDDLPPIKLLLYYSSARGAPFAAIPMHDDGQHDDGERDDSVFAAAIPPHPAGSTVLYYVEARSAAMGTTTFAPAAAELQAFSFRVESPVASNSPVVINEILASNGKSIKDSQGDYDDWIELYNKSNETVDLSGMYLTDTKGAPRKWAFPDGTTIAPQGYLIVWADGDRKANQGLHATFKLSKGGEIVQLIDKDERDNAILDSLNFGEQETDVSTGRFPNGSGQSREMTPSPNQTNRGD